MAGKTVITFGTFDVFHVGHVRVLNRSAALGDRLVVGVSSDKLNFSPRRVAIRSSARRNASRSSPMSRLSTRCSSRKVSSRNVTTCWSTRPTSWSWATTGVASSTSSTTSVRWSTCRVRRRSRRPRSSSTSSAIPEWVSHKRWRPTGLMRTDGPGGRGQRACHEWSVSDDAGGRPTRQRQVCLGMGLPGF